MRRNAIGKSGVQPPLDGSPYAFPLDRSLACEPRNFKPRVALKKLNEALADHSGRAGGCQLGYLVCMAVKPL